MTFDDRLRAELDALERSAPVSTSPAAVGQRSWSRWLRPAAVAATAAAAVLIAMLLFGQLPDRSTGDATSSPVAGVMAQDRNGDLVLTLASPRSVWQLDEAIEITASLSYLGNQPSVSIGGGGGPVVFSLRQIQGGNAEMGGGQDLPCLPYPLGPETPLVWPFSKSGAIEAAPFNRAFFEDPVLRLPPGRWEVRAWLQYGIGQCDDLSLETTIEIEVVGPLPPSASSTPPMSVACQGALASGILSSDPDGNAVLILVEDQPPVAIVWSGPSTYDVESMPVLTIYDRDGNALARAGDHITLGGGFNAGDTIFHACGITSSDPAGHVECSLPAAECNLALGAAGPLLHELTVAPNNVVVGWGRGLRVWHAEVHACWDDGQYALVDVLGPVDAFPPKRDDLAVSIREGAEDNPPCD